MFQEIVERMANKHTALAPFTTKIKVVAPSEKVLGMDWRTYLTPSLVSVKFNYVFQPCNDTFQFGVIVPTSYVEYTALVKC